MTRIPFTRHAAPCVATVALTLMLGCARGEPDRAEGDSVEQVRSSSTSTPAPSDVFSIQPVAGGIWVAEVLPRPDAYAFANSVVVAGDTALLVVDTQQSPSAARALIGWIRDQTDLAVRWVVNTHFHGDHVNGNGAYRDAWPEVRFVAHASVPRAIRTDGRARMEEEMSTLPTTLDRRQAWLDGDTLPEGQEMTPELRDRLEYSVRVGRAYLAELRDLEVVEPEVLITQRQSFDLGGRIVEIIPVGPAHTAGDVVVWIPDVGVAAVGDLLEEAAPWIEGADLLGWAAALSRVRTLEPTHVLASHGSPTRGAEILAGEALLFNDLVASALREADQGAVAGEDWPAEDAVARVVAALAPHHTFLASVGVEGAALDDWATTAARQALSQARETDRDPR